MHQQVDLSGKKTKEQEESTRESQKQVLNVIKRMVYAVSGPIIVMDPGWGVPDNLLIHIKVQRLAQNMKLLHNKEEDGYATDAEALTYLNNVSLQMPMCYEWARIYEYLFVQYCEFTKTELPNGFQKITLSEYEERLLKNLKQWLYKKASEAFEEKFKRRKKENTNQRVLEET